MNVFKRLRQLLNRKQKRTVILLIFLIFIGALLETLGVSIILPLVSAIVEPQEILENEYVIMVCDWFHLSFQQPAAFVRLMLIATMVVFAVKNIYLLFLAYIQFLRPYTACRTGYSQTSFLCKYQSGLCILRRSGHVLYIYVLRSPLLFQAADHLPLWFHLLPP